MRPPKKKAPRKSALVVDESELRHIGRMRTFLVVAALLPLAACQTKPIAEMGYSERQALANQIIDRCLAQGVPLQSRQMEACLKAEVQSEHATRSRNLERRQRFADGLGQVGEDMQRQADRQALMNAATARRNVSCTSTGYGSIVRTNCY